MADSSIVTLLSVVPLLTIGASIGAAAIAWRSKRRAVRTTVGVILLAIGIACILSAVGTLFSTAAGILIGALGALLLVSASRVGSRGRNGDEITQNAQPGRNA